MKNLFCLLMMLLLFFGCSTISFADPTNTCPSTYWIEPNKNYTEKIEYAGDVDVISITVPSNGTLTIYTTGKTDTYGDLKDSNCNTIASNDNAKGHGKNFLIKKVVTAGKYYIAIRHYSSTKTGSYGIANKFKASPQLDDGDGTCATANPNNFTYMPEVCKNLGFTIAQCATQGMFDFIGNNTIRFAGDVDYFRFDIPNSGTLTVQGTGSTDTYAEFKDSNCNTIVSNDDTSSSNRNFLISRSVYKGTYYLAIRHANSIGTGSYEFDLTYGVDIDTLLGCPNFSTYTMEDYINGVCH